MNQILNTKVVETHQLLSEYISIHDLLFSTPKGLFGTLKKIFKPMDFDSYVSNLTNIKINLHSIVSELEKMLTQKLDENEIELNQKLIRFNVDLLKTVEKLTQINQNLSNKSNGKPYSKDNYNNDLYEYQLLIDSYKVTGNTLNKIIKELKD